MELENLTREELIALINQQQKPKRSSKVTDFKKRFKDSDPYETVVQVISLKDFDELEKKNLVKYFAAKIKVRERKIKEATVELKQLSLFEEE